MLRSLLENLLDPTTTTITPQGQLCIAHSPFAKYTITNLQSWTNVHIINQFWQEHEQTFITYLTFCHAHPTPITLASVFLCGLDLHTLHVARATYQSIVPNYSFLSVWIRQIISFGHLAQCHFTQEHQTISIRHGKLYITSLTNPVTYYYPLDDQPQKLLNKTPLHIDVDKLAKAWSIHHQLMPTLRKITNKKHILAPKPHATTVSLFPSNNLFAPLWPLPLRQTHPKEFDQPNTGWCIDTSTVVVKLQSLTWPTLLYISHIDPSTSFDAITLHQSLTNLWRQYEYLLIQELSSPKQRYITATYLTQWCQTTFGMPLMSTLECVDPIRHQLDQRYQSLFNACLGAIQHIPQSNVTWCKKTLTINIYNWSICVHPMPPWDEWIALPCLRTLTPDELYFLYHELHMISIQE
jgi:hypothetical protein